MKRSRVIQYLIFMADVSPHNSPLPPDVYPHYSPLPPDVSSRAHLYVVGW